mmetsp:Transcript_68990/g.135450  ORF Transcript_68990/g.135450 Transcript_68990/m.135450 type:complete len:223 (-) Transcript_68990:91-759(-)
MARLPRAFVAAIAASVATAAQSAERCPPSNFTTVRNFDLNSFVDGRWYVQQQMEVTYLPRAWFRNVFAEYTLRRLPTWPWGYRIGVFNYAEEVEPPHAVRGGNLCAGKVMASRGKLRVAPCFLPKIFAGPYWVLAYDEEEGYALVSGGPPTEKAEGGCRTGTGVNGSGLWIFTRQQTRDQAIVDKVRGIARDLGFDLSVLLDVEQTGTFTNGDPGAALVEMQ